MLKILTCECTCLKKKEFILAILPIICGSETHEVLAAICKIHPLNLVCFPQIYFAAATYCCWSVAKDVICNHCQYLAQAMNFFVPKICLEENLVPKNLELLPIKLT